MKVLNARDLEWINLSDLKPGPKNAITDVPGVTVGHTTLIQGEPGPLTAGYGPVRTGVTAIRPHSRNLFTSKVIAGVHVLNALVAAKTMTGRDGHIAHAIPVDIIQQYLAVS